MQTQIFKKTKIAIAIGSTLMAMAGGAQAAVTAAVPASAPVVRAAKAAMTTVIGATNTQAKIDALYTGKGLDGTHAQAVGGVSFISLKLQLTPPVDGTTNTNSSALSVGADGLKINSGALNAAAATDDLNVYAGTAGASQINLKVSQATAGAFTAPAATLLAAGNTIAANVGTNFLTWEVQVTGTEALRINAATGALEYTADNTKGAATAWSAVNVSTQTQAVGAAFPHPTAIYATDSNVAIDGAHTAAQALARSTFLAAGVVPGGVSSTVSPTIKISTTSTPASSTNPALINGLLVDTITPVTLFTLQTNVNATTNGACAGAISNGTALTVTTGAVATAGAAPTVSATGVTNASSPNTIVFTAPTGTTLTTGVATGTATASPDWTAGLTAADGAAYSSTCFHTGVAGANVPVLVAPIGGVEPQYTAIWAADGATLAKATAASGVWPAQAAYTDGASPVLVSGGMNFADTDGVADLSVTFSEPMRVIDSSAAGGLQPADYSNALRELLENISVVSGGTNGTGTLAALSLNSGAVIPALVAGNIVNGANNQSVVTIKGLTTLDIATKNAVTGALTGANLLVSQGITYQEVNDKSYVAGRLDATLWTGPDGIELSGGLVSNSVAATNPDTAVAVEAVTAQAAAGTLATAGASTLQWGRDTRAQAYLKTGSLTALDSVKVTLIGKGAGKTLDYAPAGFTFTKDLDGAGGFSGITGTALAAAKTNADLLSSIVITVHGATPAAGSVGSQAGAAYEFQVRPTAVAFNATNTGLDITLPTALIQSKLAAKGAALNGMTVAYQGGVLIGKTTSPAQNYELEQGIKYAGVNGQNWTAGVDNGTKGAEPVILPLTATAAANGGNGLYSQSIKATIAGLGAGSKVDAYLATWNTQPKQTPSIVTITGGRVSNNGGADRVAQDLAIEFADKAALQALIKNKLEPVKAAAPGLTGIKAEEKAVTADPFNVYVKLIRSNESTTINNNAQEFLKARAILSSTFQGLEIAGTATKVTRDADVAAAGAANTGANTYAASKAAFDAAVGVSDAAKAAVNAIPVANQTANQAGEDAVVNAINSAVAQADAFLKAKSNEFDPVYEVSLNPNTGEITGRLTGKVGITVTKAPAPQRGLELRDQTGNFKNNADPIGSAVLNGTSLDLLAGIDPSRKGDNEGVNPQELQNLGAFLLLVATDGVTGESRLLTSADPQANNFLLFRPDLFNGAGTRNNVQVSGKEVIPTDVGRILSTKFTKTNRWSLYGFGSPSLKTAADATQTGAKANEWPRKFVGLDNAGALKSFWTPNNGASNDVALAMSANAVGVATGIKDGSTLSGPMPMVKNANAIAWLHDFTGLAANSLDHLDTYQTGTVGTLGDVRVKKGWSLVTIPGVPGAAAATFDGSIDAVINIGGQTKTPTTWFKNDGGSATGFKAGDAVFVHTSATDTALMD